MIDIYGDIAVLPISLRSLLNSTSTTSNTTGLFTGTIPAVNASVGGYFKYVLDRSLLSSDNITIIPDLGNTSDWLSFDRTNLTFEGTVPTTIAPQTQNIELLASDGSKTETATLNVNIVAPTIHMTSRSSSAMPETSTVSAIAPSPTLTNTTSGPTSHPSRRTTLILILAICIPVAVIAFLAILILFIRKRKHKKQKQQKRQTPTKSEISKPFPADIRRNAPSPSPDPRSLSSLSPVSSIRASQVGTAGQQIEIPQLELSWAPDSLRRNKERLSRISARKVVATTSNPTVPVEDISESWGDFIVPLSPGKRVSPPRMPQTPKQAALAVAPSATTDKTWRIVASGEEKDQITPMKAVTPNYSRKRTPMQALQPNIPMTIRQQQESPTKTQVKRDSQGRPLSSFSALSSNLSTCLPQPLSGAGHGSGVLLGRQKSLSPTRGRHRSSWMTFLSSSPKRRRRSQISILADDSRGENSKNDSSLGLDAFPRPPSISSPFKRRGSRHLEGSNTLRLVPESSSYNTSRGERSSASVGRSPSYRESFLQERDQYYTRRRRDQHERNSRFSHPWSLSGEALMIGRRSELMASSLGDASDAQRSSNQSSSVQQMGGRALVRRESSGRFSDALSEVSASVWDDEEVPERAWERRNAVDGGRKRTSSPISGADERRVQQQYQRASQGSVAFI